MKTEFDSDKFLRMNLDAFLNQEQNAGLLVWGPAGMGKSTIIKKSVGNISCNVFAGIITPLEFYKSLYECRNNQLLIYDDCDSLFSTPATLNLLKHALTPNVSGHKLVNWISSTAVLKDTPCSFVFNSKIIFIVNKLPVGQLIDAIKSRLMDVEYNLNWEELKKKHWKFLYYKTGMKQRM
jgi:hypothetical protein